MTRTLFIIVGYITIVVFWQPTERADGYQVIIRSNARADTFYTADTCIAMPIMPYRMYECLAAAYNDEGDTTAFGDAAYCIGFGHDGDSESRIMFAVDSLSLIAAIDSIAEFHMLTGEDFIGFYIRGERNECPVVRNLRE